MSLQNRSMKSAIVESKVYVQRERDRRIDATSIRFPLLDSDFNIVRKDRRRIPDRRKTNLKLIWQENQPIRNTSLLNLEFGGQRYYFDVRLKQFSLGRSHQCDLRIVNSFISKHHAIINHENGEFVLQDDSLNGTFIEADDLGKMRIHGQKAYLYGDGVLSLGTPIDREGQSCIHFHCS